MGFYGNIINKNNTQYVFDKIYKNRAEMDAETQNDGIYIGRYVLIDYDHDKDTTYQDNLNIDFKIYDNPRGYDSTVWQKNYINNKEEYVMIDELNYFMPTFTIVPEAPTVEPTVPYFDQYGSSNLYNLHL
jgi:hypothetical protein